MINYYFSGVGTFTGDVLRNLAQSTPYRLLSCHGAYTKFGHTWAQHAVDHDNSKKNTLLLDSGAFTAWNQGHEMTLDKLLPVYYDFMSRYWVHLKEIFLINLDKIPGSPGRTADNAEIEECIEISDKNYRILVKEFGDRVLPVFHQGESQDRLLECVDMSKYVCISPRNDLHENQRVTWSREVHAKLPKGVSTHGLAATGLEMMTTVPWTSVDSASWIFTASNGSVVLCINGKMVNLGFSEKSPSRFETVQHICNVSGIVRDRIQARLDDLGYTIEQLATEHGARMSLTMKEIQYWVDNHHRFEICDQNYLFGL